MCYNKNNLLFQLVANNMNMFPIIKSENIETLHLLSALKESVQIDYKKACCYGTSMNKTSEPFLGTGLFLYSLKYVRKPDDS